MIKNKPIDSPEADSGQPNLDLHFEEAICHQAKINPQRPAITFGGTKYSYAEFDGLANQLAQGFLSLGCKSGDRIAVVIKNCPESFLTLLAARKIGAVQVAINSRYRPNEIAWIVNDCNADVLVLENELVAEAPKISECIGRPIQMFSTGLGSIYIPNLLQWAGQFPDEDLSSKSLRQDVAIQLYTSGTTGNPKGAMITNANLRSFFLNSAEAIPMRQGGNHLIMLPLFHVAALIWSIRAFVHGGHCIGISEFNADEVLALIPKYKINDFATVNTVLNMLIQESGPDSDFSSLDAIIVGGGAFGEQSAREALKLFGCPLFSMYGSTELTFGVTVLKMDEALLETPHLLESCGQPMRDIEVGIFGPNSEEQLTDGDVGELWVRGGQKSLGYWNNPEGTRKAFREDGWFRTGDLGYLRDGYLYISDRLKDMIKSGGENVYPAEVERRLSEHPDIAEAIVIGIPHQKWGESVHAQIICRKGADLTQEDVIEFARENMARFKCPRSVEFVVDVPRTPSGKPKKNVIREDFWAEESRRIG